MTEAIIFGEHSLKVGDELTLAANLKPIRILDITKDEEDIYVVLKYGEGTPTLIKAGELAYAIQNNIYQPIQKPLLSIGDRFVHQFNNNTVEVLAISPAVGTTTNEFVYFCSLVAEDGSYAYISVDESYFD